MRKKRLMLRNVECVIDIVQILSGNLNCSIRLLEMTCCVLLHNTYSKRRSLEYR